MNAKRVLLCTCAGERLLAESTLAAARAELARRGVALWEVPDLCRLVAERDPRLAAWCAPGPVRVLACKPRAVRWLLHAAGAVADVATVACGDLAAAASGDISGVLDGLLTADAAPDPAVPAPPAMPAEADATPPRPAWFPVIDQARCRNCGQCTSFCLFGVYGPDERGWVQVRDPLRCKDHCPACARICPEVAIIFPKLPEAPLNGAEIADEAAQQARIRVDMERILGGDPYAALAARQDKRRRLLKDTLSPTRAQEERARCARAAGVVVPDAPPTGGLPT